MCIPVNNFKCIHAFKVHIAPEKYYRILISRKTVSINGYYGVCLENGFYSIYRYDKDTSIQRIIDDIINQCITIEKISKERFPDGNIVYARKVEEEAVKAADASIKEREERSNDVFAYETMVRQSLNKILPENDALQVIYTKV